jgi:transcription-repair coupling factor (superfamily II helicase)
MVLNSELLNSKELRALLTRLDAGSVTLVSGTDAVHKAHLAAALNAVTERVVVVVAPNETDAARLTADVSSLSGEAACLLNAREFTFYEAEIVSRETEHERISTLYKLLSADGTQRGSRIFVTTPDALMQRTMPPDVLLNAAFVLTQGDKVAPDALVTRLVECGYEYTEQVEGVGQFARRGGIIDFFSPALDMPVRAEFWGDEVDALGIFEPSIQRRTMNITSAVVLPSAECLTSLHQHGETGLLVALQELYESVRKRKKTKKSAAVLAASQTATEIASKAQTALLARIEADFEKINSGSMLQAVDRYMALIYEELKTAADYLPPNAIVLMCEPSRLAERAKNYLWRISEDVTALLEGGVVSGELARYAQEWDEITRKLPRGKKSVVMTDSFRAGQYPLNPRITLTLTAKQLPGYGGSLTTAADDIKRYMEERYRVAVLCADEDKAREMQTFLSEQGVSATLDFKLSELPGKGRCIVGVGSLSAGMEYPQMELAIITEGQLFSRASGVKKRSGSGDATASGSTRKGKFAKNRQKLQSYSDLSPGDLVVHEAHGIGRFLGMVQIEVDETRKEYIQIAFRGTDKVYVPATQLDTVSKYIGTGGDNETLKLSKLGGTDWAKAKSRAKAAAKNLAEGLIAL